MKLREYQQAAVDAVYNFLRSQDGNPCVVAPTASGKSLMIGQIVTDAVTRWSGRVLILAHVKELLEQNAAKVRALCPGIDIGLYSAGLGERSTTNAVVVAGIQSVYNKADLLGHFDLVLVDEAHLIPLEGDGMYRTFLAAARRINPLLRVVGFTATPYRLNGGAICAPENILNAICYEIEIPYLINNGFISPLKSYEGEAEAPLDALHIRAGEFIQEEAAAAMNGEAVVRDAVAEIAKRTADRESVIIFCASVEHCRNVAAQLRELTGDECPIVTGETSAEVRADILARFKGEAWEDLLKTRRAKRIKYLLNVNVLTTGFDAPAIDCVVLLRPTASAALYVQMVGRGFRLAPGKKDCLILDYGQNVLRHGPVNDVYIAPASGGAAAIKKQKRARVCVHCRAHVPSGVNVCPACGKLPYMRRSAKHDGSASLADVVGARDAEGPREEQHEIAFMNLYLHYKRDAPEGTPPMLRVEFTPRSGGRSFCVWKMPQAQNAWQRGRFRTWWKMLSSQPDAPIPADAMEAIARADTFDELRRVKAVTMLYRGGSNFGEDIRYELEEIPPAPDYDEIYGDYDDLPF